MPGSHKVVPSPRFERNTVFCHSRRQDLWTYFCVPEWLKNHENSVSLKIACLPTHVQVDHQCSPSRSIKTHVNQKPKTNILHSSIYTATWTHLNSNKAKPKYLRPPLHPSKLCRNASFHPYIHIYMNRVCYMIRNDHVFVYFVLGRSISPCRSTRTSLDLTLGQMEPQKNVIQVFLSTWSNVLLLLE